MHAHSFTALDAAEAVWATCEARCTCAKAATGGVLEYRWPSADGKSFAPLPASLYMSRTLAASRVTLADVAIFPPAESEGPFPPAFLPAAKKLWCRLLRVHLHAILEHGDACAGDRLVRDAFAHFYVFGKMHGLFEPAELPPAIAARVSAVCAAP